MDRILNNESNNITGLEPIVFQIIDWSQYNEIEQLDDSDELELELGIKQDNFTRYKIRLYGRTTDNKSIYVNVNDYTPFFYIKIPQEWNVAKAMTLVSFLKSKMTNETVLKGFQNFELVERKDLYGFTGYANFKFIRLIFYNMKSYKAFE